MRDFTAFAASFMLVAAVVAPASGQGSDSAKVKPPAAGIEGRWRGSIQTPQGDQEINCVIKKDGGSYTGTITGMQGDVALQEIKRDGDKVSATAVIAIPDGNIQVWYTLALKDDVMSGKAETSFNGQSYAFDLTLKRVPEK